MFKKISELLENNTISKEAAEAIDGEITVALGALRDENKTLRTEKETLSKSYDEVVKSKGDLDEQLKGLDEKIAQARKDGQGELATQLEAEKAKHSGLQESLENLKNANTSLMVDSAVSQELDKYDVKKEDKEMVSFFLRSKSSMTDDGIKYVDGNNNSDLSEAFKGYFEINGSRLNVKGEPNGSNSGSGGSGGQNTKSRGDFDKMNAGQKAKFMSDGGQVT